MLSTLGGIGLLVALISVVSPQMLPNSQEHTMNELERLYLDDNGPRGFKFAIEPCTRYLDPTGPRFDDTLGRQSAAQWIRTAFRKATFLQCSQPV